MSEPLVDVDPGDEHESPYVPIDVRGDPRFEGCDTTCKQYPVCRCGGVRG